jgi:hypothetical protein
MNTADIRFRLSAGNFEFSRHALKRAVERDIAETEIREAGASAELVEDYPDDKYSPSCLVLGFTENGRALHIQVCYSGPKRVKIVTLYDPDPGEWIDFRTRRKQ